MCFYRSFPKLSKQLLRADIQTSGQIFLKKSKFKDETSKENIVAKINLRLFYARAN